MNKELKYELDQRLAEIVVLPAGSDERKQLFEEYKTLYAQYLENKGHWIDILKTGVQGASTVGGWIFYLAMADRFMKFDASGELPNPMLKDLFRRSK